jgi:acyl-CoA reductase-like NAD-dependent aldehyde dehydrogenase
MTHAGARMLIDGELLEAAEGREREIVNPASGALLASVPDAGPADVELAVTAAARAFPAWRDATPRERSERINALADAIAEHTEELGALELANVGKPLSVGRALRLSKQLEFGTVWANDHLPFMSEMPHGGFKQSGYGKDLSTYALEDYSQVKHVMLSLD